MADETTVKQASSKNVEELIKDINKKSGFPVIGKASKMYDARKGIPRRPTGIWNLDLALGGNSLSGGGVPKGRIQEWYGNESTFKTSALYKLIATDQKKYPNNRHALVALEEFDPLWAQQMGIDLERLDLAEPTTGNQASDIIRALTLTGKYAIIGLDSIAASVPQEEMERSSEEYEMAPMAKMVNKMLRTLTGALNVKFKGKEKGEWLNNETSIILINQNRVKFGRIPSMTQPGGEGKKFFSAIRMEFRIADYKEVNPLKKTKDGESGAAIKADEFSELVWVDIMCYTIKNKTFPAKKKAVFRLYLSNTKYFKIGDIDDVTGAFKMGKAYGIIAKRKDADGKEGKIWVYKDTEINGEKKFKMEMFDNVKLKNAIIKDIVKHHWEHFTPKLLKDDKSLGTQKDKDDKPKKGSKKLDTKKALAKMKKATAKKKTTKKRGKKK